MKQYLYYYKVSADNGKTYTAQWLTKEEAEEHRFMGYIVEEDHSRLPKLACGNLKKFSLGKIKP